MERTRTFWSETSLAKRPRSVRYVAIAGGALSAVSHLTHEDGETRAIWAEGDGVHPLWSAAPAPAMQTIVAGGEHGTLFDDPSALAALGALLGAPAPDANAPRALAPSGAGEARLMLSNRAPDVGAPLSLLLRFPRPIEAATSVLRVVELAPEPRIVASWPMRYTGPPLSQLAMSITAPSAPGIYALPLDDSAYATPEERLVARGCAP